MGTLFSAQAWRHVYIQYYLQNISELRVGQKPHLLELRRDGFGIRHFLLRDLLGVFSCDVLHAPVQARDGHLYFRSRLFAWTKQSYS